ncbi:MAG: ATP synthase F0 subunit B, partial [Desulfobacteraceae bacterium]|nr:ATP synthase F0 subunit B [Desulfobacteraceae bacterium]
MIKVDGSVVIQIVNFILLIWIMNTVLYRPIRNMLLKRKEKVDGLANAIEMCDTDAKEQDEAYSAGIRAARAKGLKEKESLTQAAEDEEKKIIAKINEKAQADLAKAKEKIAKDADA